MLHLIKYIFICISSSNIEKCWYRWIYASNAEVSNGGVGAITFNSSGDVIDYEMIMINTSVNCGGGKTYWGTWVSCEETSSGQGSCCYLFFNKYWVYTIQMSFSLHRPINQI